MTENYNPVIGLDDSVSAPPAQGTTKVVEGSALERLQGALAEDTRIENYHHKIPNRKSLRVILDPNIEGDKFQAWQRRARMKTGRPGGDQDYDAMRLACTVIGNQIIGLEVKNADGTYTEVHDDDGTSMTLYSPALKAMLSGGQEVLSAAELIKKLFGNDGHLLECSRVLIEKAGYGEDDEADDDPLD